MGFHDVTVKILILIYLISKTTQDEQISNVAADERIEPRIISGRNVANGQFPYQISVRVGGQHSCGGTIISSIFVVTAAHCVYSLPPTSMSVQAGSVNRTSGGVVVNVSKITTHPEFLKYNYDIALLTLNEPLNFNDTIKPIALAKDEVPIGVPVTVSGWGRTQEAAPYSIILQYSRVFSTVNNTNCARSSGPVGPGTLCLGKGGGYGTCGGDAGGPAVYRGILIGISSYHSTVCGSYNPDGFAKISFFRDWLLENMYISIFEKCEAHNEY